jgi:glycosyltransferase involved in cell wall biosynthesis
MEEIIPMVEHSWELLCQKNNYIFEKINADNFSLKDNVQRFLEADLFVVSCFNTKIASVIKLIRGTLQLDTRIAFYVHGLATIALWPLSRFNVIEFFTSNDVFIGTCTGDMQSLKQTFGNVKAKKVPFAIPDHAPSQSTSNSNIPIAFIGRISPQKNLDSLISAYARFPAELRRKHPLFLYGAEDHLGYPNLGLHNRFYLNFLKMMVKRLGIEEDVHFKGFVQRDLIQKELGQDYIFVSPTTHSDENFGMAALRSLLSGVPCVLSDWGGHKEFLEDFSKQIKLVDVHLSFSGPGISTEKLFQALKLSIEGYKKELRQVPKKFQLPSIVSTLEEILLEDTQTGVALQTTELAKRVFRQQAFFEKEYQENQRCFRSFEDEAFVAFSKAYSDS